MLDGPRGVRIPEDGWAGGRHLLDDRGRLRLRGRWPHADRGADLQGGRLPRVSLGGDGVWSRVPTSHTGAVWTRLSGLPTSAIASLKATDDGALYIGTDGKGLWRLEPDRTTLARVAQVPGQRVLQLVYEPSVTPMMVLVLTDRGLTVLRGP